jgi:hypothetical protein
MVYSSCNYNITQVTCSAFSLITPVPASTNCISTSAGRYKRVVQEEGCRKYNNAASNVANIFSSQMESYQNVALFAGNDKS